MDEPLPLEFQGGARHVIAFLLSSLVAPTLLLDGGGIVEGASPAALADLRLSPDLLTGMPVERAIGVSVEQVERNAEHLPTTDLASVGEVTLRWRATSLQRLRADAGWLVEFAIENAPAHETELSARSVRLEALLDDLTERFESLNRYMGLISHDLQAPTRRLLSFIELLRDDVDKGVPRMDRVDAIERGARHLLRLTTELLAYSRLGRQPLLLESVDAQQVFDETVEQLARGIDEVDLQISVEEPLPTVTASPTFLSVVFQNLIENAISYRRGTPPSVAIAWRAAGDDVRITVTDNGVGIAPENRQAVFQPFRRLGPSDQTATGLGLATVRDLVSRFGGSIIVSDSEVGVGTTFTLTLPSAP